MGFIVIFAYDHTGERTLKMTGDATSVDQNAFNNHIYSSLNNVTLYPSPYLVLTNSGYTKHYYAGADRVCARIGGGGLNQDTTGIRGTSEISQRVDSLFLHCIEQMNNYVPSADTGNIVTIDGEALLDTTSTNTNKTPTGLHVDVVPNITRFNAVFDESLSENHSPRAPYYEPDVYFYHSDHLGSASWITDCNGAVAQYLQYLPFGQPFVDQHPAGYQERYTFTGKELDPETGYGYYGARYMDYELMTGWLSVDPMADKYPSISPYVYCVWNSVKLVDSDGRMIDDYFSNDGNYLGTDNAKTDYVRIMDEGRWNELNENGVIEHTIGYENSDSFSSAHTSMSQESQLRIYQHYNTTKCELFATSSKRNSGGLGMVTTTQKGISKIGIYLEDNFNVIAVADHANEITNMFIHEGQHVIDHKSKSFIFDFEYENSALKAQFKHDSWLNCRPEFRHAVTNYGRRESTLPSFILDFNDPYIANPFGL